jgi:hypothetical protein
MRFGKSTTPALRLARAIAGQNPQPYKAGWATKANSKQTVESKMVL